jgi:hypothetical protein
MRLVVGPLPASVYWRRRAMVLGGAALAVFMIFYLCGNSSNGANSSGQTPSAGTETSSASATPSRAPVAPVVIISSGPSAGPGSASAAADAQQCTDDELLVTAVTGKASMPSGTELFIKLLIKNTSGRTCTRDVGPDQQELYIKLGTQVIYSTDHCDGPTGSEVRTFPPQHERSIDVFWNGKSSSSCSPTQKRTPNGPVPDPGEYLLFGRVGTDLSEPVTLKLT